MSSGPASANGTRSSARVASPKIFGIEPKFPYVLGSDGAGTVAAVGDRVKGFKPGERVYAFGLVNPKGGFYAEYAAVKTDDVSRIPGKLTTQQAGAIARGRDDRASRLG